VITKGLDEKSYCFPSEEVVERWRTQVGAHFFLFIGILRYYKGLHVLLAAAINTAFPIVIVGSGPLEVSLKEEAQKRKIKNIIFLGFLEEEDKMALLSLCLCVLFPSHLRSEAFGLVLLEGAMLSKPLICAEIGTGTSYINLDNTTGLVVQGNDATALSEAMHKLYYDRDLAIKLGKQARERFESTFSSEIIGKKYCELYNSVVGV